MSAHEALAARLDERLEMVAKTIANRGVTSQRVLAAMRSVPRHVFVPPSLSSQAYLDRPLALGLGQTISQPYIVAAMSEAAGIEPEHRVLEIGTGCGYQTAILAELAARVHSIERLPELAHRAREHLHGLGYRPPAVSLLVGDGRKLSATAQYDAVLVTAAPASVPTSLLRSLAPGGRLVIPVGPEQSTQQLQRWTRQRGNAADGTAGFVQEDLMPVRFVPLL